MRDEEETKKQLLADSEKMRKRIETFERKKEKLKAAMTLLSKMPQMEDEHTCPSGIWIWNHETDNVEWWAIKSGGSVQNWFTGNWDEIVHQDDLNSLRLDLKSLLEGKRKYPYFSFRTKHIVDGLRQIVATSCDQDSTQSTGSYIDPTASRELVKILNKLPQLSNSFKRKQLQNFLLPYRCRKYELVSAVMWDILNNEIFKDYPDVLNVIDETILPYYEKMKSQGEVLSQWYLDLHRELSFLSQIICHSDQAVFMKTEDKYSMVTPAFASLFDRAESEILGMTDSQLFGDEIKDISSNMGKENVGEVYRQAERKLVTTKSGQTTTEFVIVQFRESTDTVWGLAFNLEDIESKTNFEDREIRYESPAMLAALEKARLVAKKDTTVLLTGESGSGKDYLAKYIHNCSKRSSGPYFSLNCASIAASLAESELFGYEKGAFTGARAKKPGLLEQAEGGTILLNEIAELPLLLQAKLLTFLETKKFIRVGGTRKSEVTVNARLIAATNTDLEQAVESEKFRRDLFHRINVVRIEVPPLRDRPEDIPILVEEFETQLRKDMKLPGNRKFSPADLQKLIDYNWDGNVRELHNVLERSIVLAQGSTLKIDLPKSTSKQGTESQQVDERTKVQLESDWTWSVGFPPQKKPNELAKEMKRALIDEALLRAGGKRVTAADLLGVSRHYLKRQMTTLGYFEPE